MTALETPARPEPVCERHPCGHRITEHREAEENPRLPCTQCGCLAFSGWAGQRGRGEAGEP